MHTEHPTIMLATCLDGYISQCNHCQELNIAYKTCLLLMDECEFVQFHQFLEKLDSQSYFHLNLPNGREYVLNIGYSTFLILNEVELEELKMMVSETYIILQTQKIICPN